MELRMKKQELDKIIENHLEWLRDSDKGQRAYLQGAYLQGAYLQGAYLQGADLQGAYLRGADLRGAYLRGADLEKTIIQLPNICKWEVTYNEYNEKSLEIGCKEKTVKEWDKWFKSKEEYDTPRDSNEFKIIKLAFDTIKKALKLKSES